MDAVQALLARGANIQARAENGKNALGTSPSSLLLPSLELSDTQVYEP